MNYIISFPRSGNTATRYLVELLTRRPTDGLIGERNPKDNLQEPLIHKQRYDYVAKKRHDFRGVKKDDFVLFIARDPLEATVRHNEKIRGISEEQMKGYLDHWFSLLIEYDDFRGNKMLWHYSELMKIANRESRMIYRNPQSGDNPDYHKAKLGKEVVKRLEKYMEAHYSFYIKKYL